MVEQSLKDFSNCVYGQAYKSDKPLRFNVSSAFPTFTKEVKTSLVNGTPRFSESETTSFNDFLKIIKEPMSANCTVSSEIAEKLDILFSSFIDRYSLNLIVSRNEGIFKEEVARFEKVLGEDKGFLGK